MDLKSVFGDILFSAKVDAVRDLVVAAVKARANLVRANLYGANLDGANLYGANLVRANNLPELAAARLNILPDGVIIGWKKCQNNVIVKLLISNKIRRSNGTGRKCRAESARVVQVFGADEGLSMYDNKTIYRRGGTVVCDCWNENRWVECGGGIHFYLTRIEAENN